MAVNFLFISYMNMQKYFAIYISSFNLVRISIKEILNTNTKTWFLVQNNPLILYLRVS